jgi:hypothetical protein
MKTAMQELIDDLDRILVKSIFERLMKDDIFNKSLKKEREQMLNEWQNGFNDAKFIFTPPNHYGTTK